MDQESISLDDEEIPQDLENIDSADSNVGPFQEFIHDDIERISEASGQYALIRKFFLSRMGNVASQHINIVAIHKRRESILEEAKKKSFDIFKQAVGKKSGITEAPSAWFPAGTMRHALDLMVFGFDPRSLSTGQGIGIFLTPMPMLLKSVASMIGDENVLKHFLFCQVITGRTDVLPIESEQCQPSSVKFDSAVDSREEPERFIMWFCNANSYILPNFVISFKAPSGLDHPVALAGLLPLHNYGALLYLLNNQLQPDQMAIVMQHYENFLANQIPIGLLMRNIREIVGFDLLREIVEGLRQ